jgi:hypothetical protein
MLKSTQFNIKMLNTLAFLELKLTSLCHQYIARQARQLADQFKTGQKMETGLLKTL